MITRVLLDLDGVLNKFYHHALHYLGIADYSDETHPVECGYDIIAAANKLAGYERFTPRAFWNAIPRHVWATAPKSEECDWLLDECVRLVGRDGVCIATSPTLDPDSLAGKLEWIHANLPPWLHRQYLVGPCKQFLAHPQALLVDDADRNIDSFRLWGGRAVLVPRPWNSEHRLSTRGKLSGFFDDCAHALAVA